ncbi:unnamed protein product [Coregonus sp. 'balchen']|nr:unnamed protein product [Coregonus sp. 'balchen']
MQYVILTYMKHLGVKVKEPRGLESKWVRINFLPKIKKSIKTEKEGGEEKVKRTRFPSILGPPRRPSRVDPTSVVTSNSAFPKLSEGLGDLDSLQNTPNTHFDYSLSPYSLDQLQEEDRESGLDGLGSTEVQSEDDQGGTDSEHDPLNWQQLVGREVLAGLRPHEIKRQEVINELFYTERAHLRMLKFSGGEEEKIKQAVGTFCSNQPFALELIKSRQKKDSRFTSFMQEAESNRLCRRLQLKDIIPVEMQRLTKYPLLLENIAKYTDDTVEKEKVKKAGDCCRKILNHVNQAVKESENKQNLDLTKKKMVHEGPLSWKVNKDKTIELYTLLLEDILVLLQKQDERLILKCHSKNLSGTADTKHIFSPIIKLNAVLVRSVATDNKSFFVLSMSDNGAQIYELMAQTVSEQRMWQRQITQRADAMKVKPHSIIHLPQTDGERDGVEIITAGVARLSKDPDRISSGSSQSIDKECSAAPCCVMQTPLPDANLFVGLKAEEEPSREEGLYGDPDRANSLPFRMAVDGLSESDGLGFSTSRADDALKTLSALKQVLVTQLMSQEECERAGRTSSGGGPTTSLRTPVDSRARVAVQNGSGRCTQASHPEDPAQDLVSGDTGFFESPEDYGELAVVTDDDLQSTGKQLSASRGCGAGDSGISLRFSSASQAGSICSFSRQVLSHLRNLQTNLNHLKEVEAKYHSLLRLRPARSSTDVEDNKDKR